MSKRTNFRDELVRLKKGVRIAWVVNFILLTLTYEAAMLFIFLSASSSNQQIASFLIVTGVIAIVAAILTIVISTVMSSKMLLSAASRDLHEITSGPVFNIVEEISIASGIRGNKIPKVYVSVGSGVANAYAISDARGNSRVIVTEEIVRMLNREELQAVIAHEFGHIASGDSQDMTKLIALTSTVSMISGVATRFWGTGNSNNNKNPLAIVLIILSLIFLMIAPLLSKIAQSYMSRTRESQADALAVEYTRNPTGLAKALLKLEESVPHMDQESSKKFEKKVGELAFYHSSLHGLKMATHPPTEQRVKALVAMGADITPSSN